MTCAVTSCDRKVLARGLCNAHYIRKRKGMPMSIPIAERAPRGQVPNCLECERPATGGKSRCQRHYRQVALRERKQQLVDYFGGKCHDCKQSFPLAVYDFHHVDGKDFGIGTQILNYSWERLYNEVKKCILLCANCHRIRHYGDDDGR